MHSYPYTYPTTHALFFYTSNYFLKTNVSFFIPKHTYIIHTNFNVSYMSCHSHFHSHKHNDRKKYLSFILLLIPNKKNIHLVFFPLRKILCFISSLFVLRPFSHLPSGKSCFAGKPTCLPACLFTFP